MRDLLVSTSRTTESISAPPTRRQPWSLDRRLAPSRRGHQGGDLCHTPGEALVTTERTEPSTSEKKGAALTP